MMKKTLFLYFMLFVISVQAQDSTSVDRERFLNLSVLGPFSLNGYSQFETTNKVAIGLIHAGAKNINGFSFAVFNYVDYSMKGLELGVFNYGRNLSGVQLGLVNSTEDANGLQLGFVNGAEQLKGFQLGFFNEIRGESKGVQLGLINSRKSRGLQIGFANSSDDNDYPIGLINIVKSGDMNLGLYTDEMSNVVATFRSGGRRLYGVIGIGASFSSSIHHLTLEGGLGVHLLTFRQFRLDTELVVSDFSVGMSPQKKKESDEEYKERKKKHDSRQAFRTSLRLFASYRFGKHIEIFAGPTINYLHSNNVKNEKIFPSHYWWRKFESSCFKQIHLGWMVGTQFRF